jgi:hypothetical protein
MSARAQPLDDSRFVRGGTRWRPRDAREHALAAARGRGLLASGKNQNRRSGAVGGPFDRPPKGFAIRVFAEDFQDRDFGEGTGRHQAALAASLDRSFFRHFGEYLFEGFALCAFDAKRARKVALGIARMGGEMGENRFARKDGAGGLSGMFGQAVLDFINP